MNTQNFDAATGLLGALGAFWFIFVFIFCVLTILLPFIIYGIYSQARRQNLLLRGIIDELRAAQLAQNKLLTQIRDPLQRMEAVGVETEEPTPSMGIQNPPSIGPRRESLHRR